MKKPTRTATEGLRSLYALIGAGEGCEELTGRECFGEKCGNCNQLAEAKRWLGLVLDWADSHRTLHR